MQPIEAAHVKKLVQTYPGLHNPVYFTKRMREILCRHFGSIPLPQVRAAVRKAFHAYRGDMRDVQRKGKEYLRIGRQKHTPIIVLSGRPYRLNPEISHGIDRLICECGAVVVTEGSVSDRISRFPTAVLNRWTYHSRLYAAAKYIADSGDPSLNFVQLVSFGCGVDAITTDAVRRIPESEDRIYSQIKIDEIANLGAVRIRLRSLFAAAEQ